jgi:hypothetical protein
MILHEISRGLGMVCLLVYRFICALHNRIGDAGFKERETPS